MWGKVHKGFLGFYGLAAMKTIASGYLASLAGLLLSTWGAAAAEPLLIRYAYTEPHMGTRFKILLYAGDESTANRAAKAAFERIAKLDDIMTDYRSSSELMRLCQKAGGEPVPVSEELFFVLSKAQEVAKRSDGAFDVTVGPIVRLWRRSRRTQQLPEPDKLAEARTLVGYEQMRLNEQA